MDRSNILHEMKALCDAAGVDRKKVFPHNLRHLFACLFYQKGKKTPSGLPICWDIPMSIRRGFIPVSAVTSKSVRLNSWGW